MNKKNYSCLKIFLLSFIMMFLSLIPGIIAGHGYYMYAGDYAYQEVPFYYHVSEAVRNGQTGWEWFNNLGADFTGSFAYYSLGSIFFWLIGWIPSGQVIVLLMPFLMAVKAGTAALSSFIYIKRYVKKEYPAFIGAMMYAFSGFQLVSLVFYTFADVIALFPFLLLSFDMLVYENKRGFFALMTAVMAFTNYFFFFGEVVFIIMYYIILCVTGAVRFNIRRFLTIALESVIGVMISAVLILPAYYSVMSVGRATNYIYGVNMFSYDDNSILPKIIKSMFMIPDSPGYSTLFKSKYKSNNWATISLYIPCFALAGVWSYVLSDKKSLISRILLVCFVCVCIPVFNSAFYMFNSAYYARWFYMPVLFMCIATAKAIDEELDLKKGIVLQLSGLLILGLISLLPDKAVKKLTVSDAFDSNPDDRYSGVKWFSMSEMPIDFWQYIAFGLIAVLLVYGYNIKKQDVKIVKKITVLWMVLIVITSSIYLENSRSHLFLVNLTFQETALEYKPELDDDEFFRINDVNVSMMNNNFIWGYPMISSFHSIDTSANERFYTEVTGDFKESKCIYNKEDYPVFSLLSVKYLFNHSTGDDVNVENYPFDINGFELYDKQDHFYIYENKNFLPMGFMYDYYITDDELDKYIDDSEFDEEEQTTYRQLVMMRALVMEEEEAEKYSDYIKHLPEDMLEGLDEESFLSDCADRKNSSCTGFECDSYGCSARISATENGMLFFSIPKTAGWSVKVNGEETDIIPVHYGLSGIPVKEGDCAIHFEYTPPGRKAGMMVSLAGIVFLITYSLINLFTGKKEINTEKRGN